MNTDLLLLHPPSYFYFREDNRNYGPISDVVPSTPIFDLYPFGFLSLTSYLGKHGYKIQIHNIAARMVMSHRYNFMKAIKKIEPKIIGIDLHWLVHAHGAIEAARIAKQVHPETPVVLGGLSSTIFYNEILRRYPWIDYVMLGDTTEVPYKMLMEYIIDNKGRLENIPNIAYRENGRIKTTGIKYIPEKLDDYWIDFKSVFKQLIRSSDPVSFIPFTIFLRDPIGAVLTVKGCTYNCITCGGSRFTYCQYFNRQGLGRKKPDTIIKEIQSILEYMRIPVFLIGDPQLYGIKFIEELSRKIREEKIDTTLFFEFFYPPRKEVLSLLEKTSEKVMLQISPESYSEDIRKRFGRVYSNNMLETFVKNVVRMNFERLDLYFMIGLPGQTYDNAIILNKYIERLIKDYRPGKKLDAFVAPLAPFVDPGSLVYNDPGKFGYVLYARTIEEHRQLIKYAKDWRQMLNYETIWMDRETIARATYMSARRLIQTKIDLGLIDKEDGEAIINKMDVVYHASGDDLLEKDTVPKGELYPSVSLIRNFRKKSLLPLILLSMLKANLRI